MKVIFKPMGDFMTNCYIISNNNQEVIIDPGVGATSWVLQNVKNPVAIFNTHGHFDHTWSNDELQKELKIPLYCPKDDIFMLSFDPYSMGLTPSRADFEVEHDENVSLMELDFKFWHFPGHTPGCSGIEVGGVMFSGDFLFRDSIGRVDFPYSNPQDMKTSLRKCLSFERNLTIYPGHGMKTSLEYERQNIPRWINII